MKKILLALFCVMLPNLAHARVELAVLAGTPTEEFLFVKKILKERIHYVDSANSASSETTDGVFYFADKNGVESAASVEILSKDGSSTIDLLKAGINAIAPKANVVLNVTGPPRQDICEQFAAHPNTVFLTGVGSMGGEFDDSEMPACLSPNILFVAGLNKELTDLADNQSWGKVARVAVPYASLRSPIAQQYSRSFGMAIVAGKMADIVRKNPRLQGASLVEKFLTDSTVYLPTLEGKISGARALVSFEQ